jgi:hypothetical protein
MTSLFAMAIFAKMPQVVFVGLDDAQRSEMSETRPNEIQQLYWS